MVNLAKRASGHLGKTATGHLALYNPVPDPPTFTNWRYKTGFDVSSYAAAKAEMEADIWHFSFTARPAASFDDPFYRACQASVAVWNTQGWDGRSISAVTVNMVSNVNSVAATLRAKTGSSSTPGDSSWSYVTTGGSTAAIGIPGPNGSTVFSVSLTLDAYLYLIIHFNTYSAGPTNQATGINSGTITLA